jgi:hypothetical protein
MSGNHWTAEPFAVHVSEDTTIARELERAARETGASVIRVDLAGVRDRDALAERLARAFLFPHETRGLDAAVDLISDLEWFGSSQGYLVVVETADSAEQVIADVAGIVPAIIDRWRSQGKPFVLVLVVDAYRPVALSALAKANMQLVASGQLPGAQPGTGAVLVVDHSVAERRPAN